MNDESVAKAPEPRTDAELTRMHGASPAEVAAEYAEAREAVNAEPPATPEPAAPVQWPFPRVSDEWVAVYAKPSSLHGPLVGELALDLGDARARGSALRAKVAELEARIAESGAALVKAQLGETEREAHLAACVERSEAALARANEALRSAFFAGVMWINGGFELGPAAAGLASKEFAKWEAEQGAQGSAAQKPEPRDAG